MCNHHDDVLIPDHDFDPFTGKTIDCSYTRCRVCGEEHEACLPDIEPDYEPFDDGPPLDVDYIYDPFRRYDNV